jgi:hypothetical protein
VPLSSASSRAAGPGSSITSEATHAPRLCCAGWRWAAVEGPVELAGPDDPVDGVEAERLRLLLREIYTAAGGTHDDFSAYDEAMIAERRVAVLLTPARVYHS